MTVGKSADGAKKYFGENLTRSDYYIDGQEIAGHWGGKAAEMLGLKGEVDAKRYFALCDNWDPRTGEQLTPRMKEGRRVGYDLTFSAPKAISVLYELSGDRRILTAFQDSYRETLTDAEADMMTRVRTRGQYEDRVTGNMVWAEFVHFTARPVGGKPDPHLHAHCFTFNLTFDQVEQRWKAGQFVDIKRDADYWEAVFHTRFAKRLNELGFRTEKDGTSFTLAGLPRSITDKFSMRRNVIEKAAAAKGIHDAEAKHAIGRYGREHKTLELGKAELRAEWRSRLSPEERAALERLTAHASGSSASGPGARRQSLKPVSADEAIQHALDHSFERASALSERRVLAEALRHGVGEVLPKDVSKMSSRKDVVAVVRDGRKMVTTEKVLNEEIAMLRFARDGNGKLAPFVANDKETHKILNAELKDLSEEQREAAMHILLSRDRVTGIRGGAGTGKTHLMRATVAALEATDPERQVFTFAPSAQASRGVLRREGFREADTLERLLVDEKLQARVRGQVIMLDEAGLASSRSMNRLFKLAEQLDCRVVLLGDYRQHPSVEAGDAFRLLESEAGVRLASLRTIRRQTEPGYRQAVREISVGTGLGARKGFDRLDGMGAVIEATGPERHDMLVSDYLKAADDGKTALIVAPTRAEGERLTDTLRWELGERGALGKPRELTVRAPTRWTLAQQRDERNYEPGMVVEFNQAVAGERKRVEGRRRTVGGYAKGERAVVTRREGGQVFLLRQDGRETVLPLALTQKFHVYQTKNMTMAAGERIRVTQNGFARNESDGKRARLNNGDIFTVAGFTRAGDIRLTNGKVIGKDYGHLGYGYVDTSYASQGKTVDRVFIATGNESLPAAGPRQWYVSVSRGREACKVYVESKAEVREALAKGATRLSAVELTKGTAAEKPLTVAPPEPRRSVGRRLYDFLLHQNRVARFMKTRLLNRQIQEEELARQRQLEQRGMERG